MSDGLLDVIIMEPFDMLEAPQVGIDMFNKTLNKNSKIKTFTAKSIHIHRKKGQGLIHFDGEPTITDDDITISIRPKGIRVVVNPHADKSNRRPNIMQSTFSEVFNDLIIARENLQRQGHRVQVLNKYILRKLNL